MPRTDIVPADPSPRKRWTKGLIDLSRFGLCTAFDAKHPLDVAVSTPLSRLQMKDSHNIIYADNRGLPSGAFVDLGEGDAMSCPELLFLEMGQLMEPAQHLMLGHELCGSFSRDSDNPRDGAVTLHLEPVTSRARIIDFFEKTRWLHGNQDIANTLELLADNAWSPTESIVATMASLDGEAFGYGMGACVMNKRVEPTERLAWAAKKTARYPDILFQGTHVGINYDGAVHLDLDSVVEATVEREHNPNAATQATLDRAVRKVRSKAVDDIRRNREIAANGFIVFPVVKEDLYEEGGLDCVMAQVIESVETYSGKDMSAQRRYLGSSFARAKRQKLIWSLLPGGGARRPVAGMSVPAPTRSQSKAFEIAFGY